MRTSKQSSVSPGILSTQPLVFWFLGSRKVGKSPSTTTSKHAARNPHSPLHNPGRYGNSRLFARIDHQPASQPTSITSPESAQRPSYLLTTALWLIVKTHLRVARWPNHDRKRNDQTPFRSSCRCPTPAPVHQVHFHGSPKRGCKRSRSSVQNIERFPYRRGIISPFLLSHASRDTARSLLCMSKSRLSNPSAIDARQHLETWCCGWSW